MKRLMFLVVLMFWGLSAHAGINLMSGNLNYRQSLFAAEGGALPLKLGLVYDSLDPLDSMLGAGWSHSYDIYLHENSDGTLVLNGGAGKRFYFPNGSGNFTSRPGDVSQLSVNPDGSAIISFPSGMRYEFGTDRQISAIIDRHGNQISITHASDGNTTILADSAQRQLIITYTTISEARRIDYIDDPALNRYDFLYDSAGRLWKVSCPEPVAGEGVPVWEYRYHAGNGLLAYVIDPKGQATYYGYDAQQRVDEIIDPGGVLNADTDLFAPEGHSKSYAYGFARTHADPGATTLTEQDGGQWVYYYDTQTGVMTGKEDPDGQLTEYRHYTSGAHQGLRYETVTPVGSEFDGSQTIKTVHVTQIRDYDGNGNATEIMSFARQLTYDSGGNLIQSVDGAPDRHQSYRYHQVYNRPDWITDHLAGTTTDFSYQTLSGGDRVTITAPKVQAADPVAPQTVMLYNPQGQLTEVTTPDGRQVSYVYDPATGLLASLTGSDGVTVVFGDPDPFGRPQTLTQQAAGESDKVTRLSYDALGQVRSLTREGVAKDVNGDPLLSYLTRFGYDLAGNRTSVTDAETNTTRFTHNYRGQVRTITDAFEQVTELVYSGAGCASCGGGVDKLVGVIDANHTGDPEPRKQSAFRYYTTGELKSESDPLGKTLLYTYTDGGQLHQKLRDVNGDGEVDGGDQLLLSFTYYPDGQLKDQTDYLTGEITSYTYYPNGRMQTAVNPHIGYTFTYYDNGWVKSVTDGTRTVNYAYPPQNDVFNQKVVTIDLGGGQPVRTLTYINDAQGRPWKIHTAADLSDTPLIINYDAWGRRDTLSYPNGVLADYSYHADMDWLTGIDYQNAGVVLGYPEHDKVGNRKARTEDGVQTDYQYDELYQLRQAKTGAAEENLTYDAVGNRTSGPTVKEPLGSYDHDDANRMLQGRKLSYGYDDFGNQQYRYLDAAKTKYWQLTWNGNNQLVEARLVADAVTLRTVSFKYDPFGRRIEKRVEGLAPQVPVPLTTTYLYDGEDIVHLSENDGTTTTATDFVHGPGIDEPLAMVRGGQSYYYHADGLESVVAVTDSSKAVVARYSYDAFGMVTASDPGFPNAYAFTGREWDKEIGLYYYRARYYDPMDGRFLSKDPIGIWGKSYNKKGINKKFQYFSSPNGNNTIVQTNLYSYTDNNPIVRTDPDGLWWQIPVGAGIVGGGLYLHKKCMDNCLGDNGFCPDDGGSRKRYGQCAEYCTTLAGMWMTILDGGVANTNPGPYPGPISTIETIGAGSNE